MKGEGWGWRWRVKGECWSDGWRLKWWVKGEGWCFHTISKLLTSSSKSFKIFFTECFSSKCGTSRSKKGGQSRVRATTCVIGSEQPSDDPSQPRVTDPCSCNFLVTWRTVLAWALSNTGPAMVSSETSLNPGETKAKNFANFSDSTSAKGNAWWKITSPSSAFPFN